MNKRIAFIGAHYDDIELSCAGTIVKYLEDGYDVVCLSFSDCTIKELPEEMNKSMKTLGVKNENKIMLQYPRRTLHIVRQNVLNELISFNQYFEPDAVFTHSAFDRHQDHVVVGQESLRAFRNIKLITYTTPWNDVAAEQYNLFVSLTKQQLAKKTDALACYESQCVKNYMSPDYTIAQARTTGGIVGLEFAEAFKIERWIK